MRVRWLRSALRDLDAQLEFLDAANPDAAVRLTDRLQRSMTYLAEYPELGRAGRVLNTRELVVPGTPWVVVYRLSQEIDILRVLHAAQHWPPAAR